MSRRSKQRSSGKLKDFPEVFPDISDEILDAYSDLTIDNPDFFLHQIPELFSILKIPECFTDDIITAVNYYYGHMADGFELNLQNHKQFITLQLLRHFTITNATDDPSNIIDIIDIDKVIRSTNKLVKFRNSFRDIYTSWKLFINSSNPEQEFDESTIVNYQLTLPDLKKIKTALDLDTDGKHALGDSFLIDMLGCCSTDSNGDIFNYDFKKIKNGSSVSIKDFAEILGNLGEFD